MSIKQNPTHTYKALLWDYDALLEASERECSICLTEREIAIILASVEYIGWKTRYMPTETEIDQSLILQWQGNLARKLMSCCGDDGVLHRYTEGGVYQSSEDGGVTWEDDPDGDPRNTGTQAPPLPGDPSDGKRCAGADNVRSLFKSYRDNLASILGGAPLFLEILSGIVAFIGVLIGVSGVGIGISVLFLTLAAQLASMSAGDLNASINDTVLDTFKCLVYCRMNGDGELTYEAWQGLLADIAGEFSGFAETFFYQTVAGMGYIGVNNAATMGDSTASDCGDCGCGPNLCGDPDNWVAGTISDIVTNEDGTTTFTISSVHVTGAEYIRWGDPDNPDICCTYKSHTIISAGPGGVFPYNTSCGQPAGTLPTPGVLVEDVCYQVMQFNGLDGEPFEVTFTIGGGDGCT